MPSFAEGFSEKAEQFTEEGGVFLASAYTGIVDEHDLAFLGGYPGPLKKLLGIWVEETDVLPPDQKNAFLYKGVRYEAGQLFDILGSREPETEALSYYESDFYAGTPVITRHPFGEGAAYYVGTRSTEDFYTEFIRDRLREAGIRQRLPVQDGVEVTCRENEKAEYLFILNHNSIAAAVKDVPEGVDLLTGRKAEAGSLTLPPKGVCILKKEK